MRKPTTFQSVLGHFFTLMKFIFEKSAGSEDFQQECLDALTKKYKNFDGFLYDFSQSIREFYVLRELRSGWFTISLSKIDVINEIIYIDFLGIG